MSILKAEMEKNWTYPFPIETVDDIHQVQLLVHNTVLVDELNAVLLRADAEFGAQKLFEMTNAHSSRTLKILDLWFVFWIDLR